MSDLINNEENLLSLIKNDKYHPFHDLIDISEDCTMIKSNFKKTNQWIKIYGNKFNAEELSREIFLSFFPRLQINKNIIDVETLLPNCQERADVVCQETNNDKTNVFYILEFKALKDSKNINSKGINNKIIEAQEQLFGYAKNIVEQYQQKNDIYCSSIVIDIERIIKEPSLIDKFNNNVSLFKTEENFFKHFGIIIKNVKFNAINKEFIEETNKFSQNVPVLEKFNILNNEETISIVRNCIDAYNTITCTNVYGLNNVRERKKLDNPSKRNLFKNMVITFIENGLKKEDEKVFYKNSDQKSFIYINSETIKTLENNKIYITSTNAALINGQQSTHIPHLIKESLLKIKNENRLNEEDRWLKAELEKTKILSNKVNQIAYKIDDIINFLNKCYFNYFVQGVETPKEGMEIADAKNFSISVDKDELAMIGETGAKYKYLSQEIADHNSVVYSYSNVYNEFSNKPKSNIDIKKVVSLNIFFNEDRVLQNDNIDLYKSFLDKNKISKQSFVKNINTLVKTMNKVDENNNEEIKEVISQIKEETNSLNEIEKEYKIANQKHLEVKNLIETLNNSFDLNEEDKDELETKEKEELDLKQKIRKLNKQIEEIKRNIDYLKERRSILNDKYAKDFEIENKTKFDNLCQMLANYEKAFLNFREVPLNEDIKLLDIKESKIHLLDLILLIISKKNNVLLRNFTEEYFNEISVVLNNIIQLKKDYEFSWISDLGNGKSRESYQQIKLKDITAEDLINKMFNYKETTSFENKEVEEKVYQGNDDFVEEDEQNILEDFLND